MSAPLANLKILDFSSLLPGPYASMMLADLGAEVLRVEAPNRPELTRLLPPFDADGQAAGHALLNRNKRSLGLNLKHPAGAEIVKKLINKGGYDIVLEQSRPGVMARLGVGYEALRAVCPQLIYCSLTGYGQTGPYRDRAGHDLNYLALSGILAHHGRQGTTPAPLPTQVADIGGGSLHLIVGLLSAVIRRTATGVGGHVDISMHDGALAWNALAAAEVLIGDAAPAPEQLGLNGGTFYDLYETQDGGLLSVGSLEPKFWRQFCQAIGCEHLFESGLTWDPARQRPVKAEIRDVIKTKSLAEWTAIFADYDACVEPVLTTQAALDHPQTEARQMVVAVPTESGSLQPQVGSPIKMTDFRPKYRQTGGALGADTLATMRQLGYAADEITTLLNSGAIAAPPP